ncbi:MAG: Hsp20/alpha crystallin family protein [Bdellovibrionales bacterium]|nr:Hsp20/alpha crystallin family protein [Bdellovibrionales bacterium]
MTRLRVFNPSRNLFSDFDRFFENPFEGYTSGRVQFTPEADVEENDRSYLLSFDLPGLTKEDVHVEIEGDALTVTGERKWQEKKEGTNFRHSERRYGKFTRSFRLPQDVDTSKIEAVHKDGVLQIVVPKVEAAKPKKIEVRDSGNL